MTRIDSLAGTDPLIVTPAGKGTKAGFKGDKALVAEADPAGTRASRVKSGTNASTSLVPATALGVRSSCPEVLFNC